MLHVTFYVLHFVHHLLLQWFIASKLSMVVRSFRLLFSSYLHLTLTVFHQLIIPLRYLTIKIRNQSLFPLLCIVRAVSPRSISHPSPIWWFHQSLLFCLRAIFWLLWFHHDLVWVLFAVAVFYISNFLFASYAYDRANTPSSIDSFVHWHLFYIISSSLLAFNIYHWSSNRFIYCRCLSLALLFSLFDQRCSLRIYLSFPYSVN